jgi:hypothetical protein
VLAAAETGAPRAQDTATKETKRAELLIHKPSLNTWILFDGSGQANSNKTVFFLFNAVQPSSKIKQFRSNVARKSYFVLRFKVYIYI